VDPETRAYLDELRHEMNRRFDRVDGRLDGVTVHLDGVTVHLDGVDGRLDGVTGRLDGVTVRLDGVDARLTAMDAELRRHFGVLIEHVRHENQIVAEMVVANTEAIARLGHRLDVR
jgi:hypothetical protein